MNLVIRIVANAFLICTAAVAQDFTGKWTGAADSTYEAGTKRQEKQSFEIKMEDGKLVAQQLDLPSRRSTTARRSGSVTASAR